MVARAPSAPESSQLTRNPTSSAQPLVGSPLNWKQLPPAQVLPPCASVPEGALPVLSQILSWSALVVSTSSTPATAPSAPALV